MHTPAPTATAPDATEWTLPVEGMECASCAVRIEKQLRKRTGVLGASVNLASNEARISTAGGSVHLNDLVDTIERTGFHVPNLTFEAPLRPDASPDETALEAVFERTNGVLTARIENDGIVVRYVPGVVEPAVIQELLVLRGYIASGAPAVSEVASFDPHALAFHSLFRRFLLAAVCTLPVAILSMAHGALDFPGVHVVLLVLTTPVVVIAGGPFFQSAWRLLRHGGADMNTLVALGVGSA